MLMTRSWLFCLVVLVAMLCRASSTEAALAYSFEGAPPPDGFMANGGGVTVTQDTIGTTEGSNSMKVNVVAGATFVGALTTQIPPPIGDPPGIQGILYDLTINAGQAFPGSFAVIGVTIFGASQPDYPGGQQFGLQAQFADFDHVDGLAPGTYPDMRIDLNSATHPLTFNPGSFNDIFGTVGSGINDLIPTGFQLFFNKSNDATMTVYIDNVRTIVPEPAMGMLSSLCLLGLALRRRR